MMSGPMAVVGLATIYDGRDRLGEVAELGNGQYRAETAGGVDLGLYSTRKAAQEAVLQAAGRKPEGGNG